jgi:hypothetical protein
MARAWSTFPIRLDQSRGSAARFVAQLFHDRRQAQVFERFNLVGNGAKDRADGAALVEQVRAETRQAFDAEREVEFQVSSKRCFCASSTPSKRAAWCQRKSARDTTRVDEMTVHSNLRRRARGDVQVRTAELRQLSQQFGQ